MIFGFIFIVSLFMENGQFAENVSRHIDNFSLFLIITQILLDYILYTLLFKTFV